MIFTSSSVWLGRHEVLDKKDAALQVCLDTHRARMETSLQHWWPEHAEALQESWNVALFHGAWGSWTTVDFLVVSGLGVDPAPWVDVEIAWSPRRGRVNVRRFHEVHAPVLRDSGRLLTAEAWPAAPGEPRRSAAVVLGLQQRLDEAGEELRKTGAWADPTAATRAGLLDVLWSKGLELVYVSGSGLRRVRPALPERIEKARGEAAAALNPERAARAARIPEEETAEFWISGFRSGRPGQGGLQRPKT